MQPDGDSGVFRVLSSDDLIYGPISLETLLQWVRERRVQRATWVHREPSNEWVAAGTLEVLQGEFDAADAEPEEASVPAVDSPVATTAELRQFERFEPFSNAELELILGFCDVVVAAQGELIIKKGDLSDCLYLVLSGQVRARMVVGSRDTSLGVMEPGELFGEVAMLSQTPRSADVVAEVPTRLLQLTSDRFRQMMSDHPALSAKVLYNISRLLARRLAQRNVDLQKDLASAFVWR